MELTQAQLEAIVELYIAYFNRAPETAGLDFHVNEVQADLAAGLTFEQALNERADNFYEAAISMPAQTGYSASQPTSEFVATIYENTLLRPGEGGPAPTDAEIAYWVAQLESGAVSRGEMISKFIDDTEFLAENGTEAEQAIAQQVVAVLDNRVEVGLYFARPEISGGLTGDAAYEAGVAALEGVDETQDSVDAAKARLDGDAAEGQTFTLTDGSDIIDSADGNLVGSEGSTDTSGDDTIIAGVSNVGGMTTNTLGSGDVIDAGAGFDTLRVIDEGSTLTPNLESVERVNVQALGGATNLNLINANGIEQLWNVDSTGNVNAMEINDDLVLGFQDTDTNLSAMFDENVIMDGAVDVAIINSGENPGVAPQGSLASPTGAVELMVDVNDSAVTEINVSATGEDASAIVLDVFGSSEFIETLNISGDSDLYLNSGGNFNLSAINSTSTGNLDLVFGGNTEDLMVSLGGGDDRLVLSAAGFDADDSIDLGEGDDTLELHFGGAGPIVLDDMSVAVEGANAASGVENFVVDVWQAADESIDLDVSAFDSIMNFTFNDTFTDGFGGLPNVQDELDGDITVTEVMDENMFTLGTDVNMTASFEAAAGQSELNLSTGDDINTLATIGFETVNLELTDDDSDFVATMNGDADTSFVVTGVADTVDILLDDEDDLSLDVSGVETNGSIEIDMTGATTTYNAAGANFLEGGGGENTLVGTEQDDFFIGGSQFNPAGFGETVIDLNNLSDTDGDNDGTDDALQSFSVDIDTDGDDVTDTTYTAVGSSANSIGASLAAQLQDDGFDAVNDSGIVTITSATPNAVDAENATATVDPAEQAAAAPTGAYTPGDAGSGDTVGTQTLTFTDAAGTYGIGDTITYTFDDGNGGDATPVSYTVTAADVATADPQQIAANVAAGFVASFIAATGATDDATASRSGNVVSIVSNNAGGTGDGEDVQGVETLDTPSAVTSSSNPGQDAVAPTPETFALNSYNVNGVGAGNTGTLEITVDGVAATFAGVQDGDVITGAAIAAALETADTTDSTFNNDDGNATLNFTNDNATAPVISATIDPDSIAITQDANGEDGLSGTGDELIVETDGAATTVLSADTFTGGAGSDVFVIESALNAMDMVTADGADEVTDFTNGEDLLDFANLIGGTEDNYSEGPVNGFGNFNGALVQAQSDFAAEADLRYSAQQVGEDTYVFFDADGNGGAPISNVVKLAGVSLTDLADDGSFIAA